jgi:peptide methionine sulfoxide reductase MsrB
MKAYQAYANGFRVTKETPRQAAIAFFEAYPNKRKCSIIEGTVDGNFFTVRYGRKSTCEWPSSWKDITKKTMVDLPDSEGV